MSPPIDFRRPPTFRNALNHNNLQAPNPACPTTQLFKSRPPDPIVTICHPTTPKNTSYNDPGPFILHFSEPRTPNPPPPRIRLDSPISLVMLNVGT